MSYERRFINPYPFENQDKLELVKLVQRKEMEGWEMVRPIFPTHKNAFHGNDGQINWVALMEYKGSDVR